MDPTLATDDDQRRQQIQQALLAQSANIPDGSQIDAAKDEAKRSNMIAGLGQALEGLARSKAMARGGQGIDTRVYDSIAQQGQQGVKNAIDQRQQAIASALQGVQMQRQAAQDKLAQDDFGLRKDNYASEADSRKANEAHQKMMEDRDSQRLDLEKQRIGQSQQENDMRRQDREDRLSSMQDDKLDKRLADFQKSVTPESASSRSGFGRFQKVAADADKVLQLGEQAKTQEGGLDKRQIHELAISTANLLSGGSGGGAAQGTIQALVPHSVSGTIAGIEEWITNNPTGSDQQKFVDRMLETAQREKHLATEKLKEGMSQLLPAYQDLKTSRPDQYQQLLNQRFGEDAQFDKNGKYVPQSFKASPASINPQDQSAMSWAKANPSDPRSAKILDKLKAKGY